MKLMACFVDWNKESKLLVGSRDSNLLKGSFCLCLKLRMKKAHLQDVFALVARCEMNQNDL